MINYFIAIVGIILALLTFVMCSIVDVVLGHPIQVLTNLILAGFTLLVYFVSERLTR